MNVPVTELTRPRDDALSAPGAGEDAFTADSFDHQVIEKAAYFHWVDRGRPWGDALTDWSAAEADVRYGRRHGHRHGTPAGARLRRQVIREVAYLNWLARGRPWGDPLTDWLTAETSVGDTGAGR